MNKRMDEIQVSERTPSQWTEVTPDELTEVQGGVAPRITVDPHTGTITIKGCTEP